MKRDLIGLTILGLSLCCPAWAEKAPISIGYDFDGDATPSIELFSTEPPFTAQIKLAAKVKNETDSDLALSSWNCSYYEDWLTDNKAVEPEVWGCLRNFPESHIIKAGEIYTVPMKLDVREISGDTLRFRLGYKAYKAIFDPKTFPHDLGREEMKDGPFWSGEIILPVKLPPEEKQKYWHDKWKWQKEFASQQELVPEKDGVNKRYYFTGELLDERNFKNGKLDGPSKNYFQNGKIRSEANYNAGKLEGSRKQFDENGRLNMDELYADGELASYTSYNPDGSIHGHIFFMQKKDGKWTHIPTCAGKDSDDSLPVKMMLKCNFEPPGPQVTDAHPILLIVKGLFIPKEMPLPENATIWLEDGVEWPEGIKIPKGTVIKKLPPGQTAIPSNPN